jgi:hypothetical protein
MHSASSVAARAVAAAAAPAGAGVADDMVRALRTIKRASAESGERFADLAEIADSAAPFTR